MNVRYFLHGITFEWDSYKAASNLRKHGVSFEAACDAFFDPFIFYGDDDVINEEKRESIIGLSTTWQMLYVVFVMQEDIIRIISARPVTRRERIDYESQ